MKKALFQPFNGAPRQAPAVLKYEQRGWEIIEDVSTLSASEVSSMFPRGARSMLDSKTLKIEWEPQLDLPPSSIGLNRWRMYYDSNMLPHIKAVIYRAVRLRSSYLSIGTLSKEVMKQMWQHINNDIPGEQWAPNSIWIKRQIDIEYSRFLDDRFADVVNEDEGWRRNVKIKYIWLDHNLLVISATLFNGV